MNLLQWGGGQRGLNGDGKNTIKFFLKKKRNEPRPSDRPGTDWTDLIILLTGKDPLFELRSQSA